MAGQAFQEAARGWSGIEGIRIGQGIRFQPFSAYLGPWGVDSEQFSYVWGLPIIWSIVFPTSNGRPVAVDREFVYIVWRFRFLPLLESRRCVLHSYTIKSERKCPQPGAPEDWGQRLETCVSSGFPQVFQYLDARLGKNSGEPQMRFACVYHQLKAKVSPGRRSRRLGQRLKTLVFLWFSLGFSIFGCQSWNEFWRAADAFCMRIPSNQSKSVPSQAPQKTGARG